MSNWVQVNNLPVFYDEFALRDVFEHIGQIELVHIEKNELLRKATGFIQFSEPKFAKKAVNKIHNSIIHNNAVVVRLVWNSKENLSTIKVENLPNSMTQQEIEKQFEPFGSIVDIRVSHKTNKEQEQSQSKKDQIQLQKEDLQNKIAWISFCKVEYALQAVQGMNNNIVGMGCPLSVELMNPDARNLKWKRETVEYVRANHPILLNDQQHNHNRTYTSHRHNNNHHRTHHDRHHHHGHRNNNHHKQNGYGRYDYHRNYHHQNGVNDANADSNSTVFIVNKIGKITNNINYKSNQQYRHRRQNVNDDGQQQQAEYVVNHHHRQSHSLSPNPQRTHSTHSSSRGRSRTRHHRQDYQRRRLNNNNNNFNNNEDSSSVSSSENNIINETQRIARKYRQNRSYNNESRLLGPLSYGNGKYLTYSVTPSPTRSESNSHKNVDSRSIAGDGRNNNHLHSHLSSHMLRKQHSADSISSNSSTHSVPTLIQRSNSNPYHNNNNNHHHHRQQHHSHHTQQHHHGHHGQYNNQQSALGYYPLNNGNMIQNKNNMMNMGQLSPATTISNISTPSTTHSMPTPSTFVGIRSNPMCAQLTPTGVINSLPNTPTTLSNSTTATAVTPTGIGSPNTGNNGQCTPTNTTSASLFSPNAINIPLIAAQQAAAATAATANTPQSVGSPGFVLNPQANQLLINSLHGLNIQQNNVNGTTNNPYIVVSPPVDSNTNNNGNNTNLNGQKIFSFSQNGNKLQSNTKNTKSPPSGQSSPASVTSSCSNTSKNKKNWSNEQEKLGNRLYPLLLKYYPKKKTGKIVGMILQEKSIEEIVFYVNHPDTLKLVAQSLYDDYSKAKRERKSKKQNQKFQ